MAFAERRELYAELENIRKRPLIAYVTSTRPGVESKMLSTAVPELLDQLVALPKEADKLDLLVVSHGGDPMMAWRTMTLLHERVKHVAVLVPQVAYSAATMLAMGAHEIVMHPHGNLGPVDPQIQVIKDGKPSQQFGFEDLSNFLQFLRGDELKFKQEEQIQQMFAMFCRQVGPLPVAIAARSSLLTVTMGTKLLMLHMDDEEKAKQITETLSKRFFNHGYPVSRKEAKDDIGLKIAERDDATEDLIWRIWLDIEEELQVRKPFNPAFEIFADNEAREALLCPVSQANIPINAPQTLQIVHNVQQTAGMNVPGGVAKGVFDALSKNVKAVDFKLTTGIMESTRKGSFESLEGKVIACRFPDLNIRCNPVPTQSGWLPRQ